MQAPSRASRARDHDGPKDVRQNKALVALAEKAHQHDQLDQTLRRALPVPLCDHVRVAGARHGRLVFLAPSPAWAARVRMAQAQILAAARAAGMQADSVMVKVASPDPAPMPEGPRRAPLSRAAATHLRTAARTLSDPELRNLFLELASLAESRCPGDRN